MVSLRVHVKDPPILPCCHKTEPDRVLTRCNCSVQSPILVGGGWTEARCQGKSSTANPRLPLKSRTFNRKTKASTNALQATCAGGTWRRAGSFSTVSSRSGMCMRACGAVLCSTYSVAVMSTLWRHVLGQVGKPQVWVGMQGRVSAWSVHAVA